MRSALTPSAGSRKTQLSQRFYFITNNSGKKTRSVGVFVPKIFNDRFDGIHSHTFRDRTKNLVAKARAMEVNDVILLVERSWTQPTTIYPLHFVIFCYQYDSKIAIYRIRDHSKVSMDLNIIFIMTV